MHWLKKGTPLGLFTLTIFVGLGAAIGSTLFHFFIFLSTALFYGHTGSTSFLSVVESIPTWQRILIPTLGGLLVGILFSIAKVSEAEGEGVPEVMEALAHHRGTIRPLVAPIKILSAAITLGSGGSAGREGPVIQIGSAIGSSIAQFFSLPSKERRLLLACGAAAAIGGTFGAPLAGILFTLEILRHRPRLFFLFFVTTAATIGYFATHILTGHEGLRLNVTLPETLSLSRIMWILVVALCAAMVARSFASVLHRTKEAFTNIHAPHYLKPALGGFAIGLIGIYLPHIHEPAAYPIMVDIVSLSTIPVGFLLILLCMKILATGITLGSGGSGGVFAPTLLIGAITGALVSSLLLAVPNSLGDNHALLIVSGMAAAFAAIAYAPFTAAFICFEIIQGLESPSSLVPLIISSYAGYLLYRYVFKGVSLYSLPLPHEDDTAPTQA